jgi:hypothetical protein
MLSGLGATIAQGFAFGTGSAIAHRAVGAVADSLSGKSDAPSRSEAPAAVPAPAPSVTAGPCDLDLQAFNKCMRENRNDVTSCDFYYQALQSCQADRKFA